MRTNRRRSPLELCREERKDGRLIQTWGIREVPSNRMRFDMGPAPKAWTPAIVAKTKKAAESAAVAKTITF